MPKFHRQYATSWYVDPLNIIDRSSNETYLIAAVFDPSAPGGIDQLLTTNQAWIQNEASTISPNLFTTTLPKQVPKILWLGCSDSRVPETVLLGLNPGEVFTHRNIANLINPQDVSFPAVLAYAVEHVGVSPSLPSHLCI